MAQLFTPTPMEVSLGFDGEETEAELNGSAAGTEDDVPDPVLPSGDESAPEAPGSTEAPSPTVTQPLAVPVAPVPESAMAQPSLADILARMEAQASRQTQILERAVPAPQVPAPLAPGQRPLPVIPEQYRGAIDEDTLRGAQVVMDILGITPKLERLEQFEQATQQRENTNSARDMIISQVPEMKEQAFQDEVAAEMTRTMDAMGVPNEMRGQFLNPVFVVQAGNAVKARRSQSAVPAAAPTLALTQALASRAGGETQSEPVAASVSDSSQQPVDWLDMSEEDFAKKQAAILRKHNGSW
jgi:hypothetical protein